MGEERTFESFREALAYLKANEFGVLNHPDMERESFLFVKTDGTLWFYDIHEDDITPQTQTDIIEMSDPVEWPPIDMRGNDTWAYYPGDQFEATNGGVPFFDQLRKAPAMIESSLTSKMRKLVESMELHEGYEDRIAQAASLVSGQSKAEILLKIQKDLEMANSRYTSHLSDLLKALPELRLKSRTAGEAQRDLFNYMSKNKMLARAKGVRGPSTRAPYYVMSDNYSDESKVPVTHDDVAELGNNLLTWAGESFPDGDPNDRVYHWMKRKGWDVGDGYDRIMPVACKKYLGTKNYSEYLAQLWDDVYRDQAFAAAERAKNPKASEWSGGDDLYHSMGGDNAQNPWR